MTAYNRNNRGISWNIPHHTGWIPIALALLALVCFAPVSAFAQTWNGSTSDLWLTGTNWNGNTAPNSSSAVVDILSSTNNPVVLNGSASISTLTMGSSTSLNITSGVFSVYGATISNAGMISLDSQVQLDNNVTLSGAGTLTMVNGQFGTNGTSYTLTNQSTIVGYGLIGSNSGALYQILSLSNSGTINANSSTNTLTITGTGTAISNSGTLEATGGGILDLATSSAIDDSGGKITATGSGSTVEIGTTIQGGTLKTSGGGIIETTGTATLDASTDGAITLSNGTTYTAGSGTTTKIIGTLNLGTTAASTLALGGQLELTGNTTLTGPGSLVMTSTSGETGQIGTDGTPYTLTNQSTISGSGLIGSNPSSVYPNLSLINSGTINANSSGNTLAIGGSGTSMTNTGTFEATSGGILSLATTAIVDNNTGTITANGGTVDVSTTIQGGTLSTSNGGVMQTVGTADLDAFTQGAISLTNGSTYTSGSGTLTKIMGTLNLGATNAATTFALGGQLQLTGNTTLSGPGSLVMTSTNSQTGQIGTDGTGYTLTNESVISGSGLIGSNASSVYPSLSLDNTGTIDANSSGNTLGIGGDGTSIINTGKFEATGGGILSLGGTAPIANQNGKISATGSGSTVEVGATIQGGTLITSGGGVIETSGNNANLDGSTLGAITLANGSTYSAGAGLTNIIGALNLGTTSASTLALSGQLRLTGDTTLSGPGFVTMSGGPNVAQIGTNGGSDPNNVDFTLFNESTIQGFGLIGSNVGSLYETLSLNNSGTVNSNSSGNTLTIAGSGVIANTGLLEATSGGILAITATNPVNNLNGNITANGSGSTVEFNNTIQGGTLNTLNGGVMETVGTDVLLDGVTQGAITLSDGSTYTAPAGTLTGITGTLKLGTTTGSTLALGANGQLRLTGNTTLSGPGSLTMTTSGSNVAQIGSDGTLYTLTNQSTIQGSGLIGSNVGSLYSDLSLANSGTVNATGGTLTIAGSGTTTNTGTMAVQASSLLDITNTFTNFNSGTGTLTGGTYNVNGGTFQFNGANIETNAADIILTGAASQIISDTDANALANFAINDGTFQLGAGRSFTTSGPGGNFTNNGSLIVGGGDTFEVSGALSNFASSTLTGGTYYVAGTLQFGASGSQLVTNDANLTLAGPGAKLLNLGGGNLLSSFSTNASGANFTVAAGGSYTTPGAFTNSGTMDLEQASSLTVSGTLTNNGAVDTNNQNLGGGANTLTVTGTLNNQTGATVTVGANNDTADVASVGLLTNAGTVTVDKGATLKLTTAGADSNTGAIALTGGTLSVQAGTLTNSGTLDEETGGKLTTSGGLVNNGTITTNNSNAGGAANSIAVAGTLTNNTGHSVTIGVHGDTTDTASVGLLSNAGNVTVDAGATFKMTTAGTDTNSGTISVDGGTLNVAAGSLTNSSTLDLEQKGTLTVTGNLTNGGTLTTNNSNLGGGANTITVTGTLTNNSGDSVTIGANNDTTDTASVGLLSNAGTVTVDKGATLKLTATGADSNTGSIALDGGAMSVATGGAFTNSSTIDAENGGKLTVTGGFTNAGTLSTNGANLGGTANAITITGKLTNNAGATVTIGANNDTSDKATLGTLGNSGTVNVDTGASLTLSTAGTDTNAGTIAVSGTLDIKAATTLSGAGSLTLTNGAITGVGTGITLSNASTIQGSGTISNLGITNGTTGILSANQSAALIILPTAAGLNNKGTLGVSAGDTMKIGTSAGGALTNFSGTTLTGGTYNVAGTLQFGASGTTIATNAATITMSGAGQMLDFGNHNILAGFNNNAAAGSFTLAAGAALTTTGGTFTNSGLFTVSTGTTFTVGGSTFNFNQAAGTSTVNGTLTSSTLGTLDVTGGSLFGSGTVGDNVVDGSVLSPGTSVAATGKLTVADAYTQQSAGALDIAIDGAAAGTKYDQLSVTKGATLGGTLNISLGAGFTPTVGETFTILTASTVSDTFATVNGLAINGSEHFTITYNAGSVVLKVVAGALPASSTGPSDTVAQLIHPVLNHGAVGRHGSDGKGRYGIMAFGPRNALATAMFPATSMTRVPTATLARIPATSLAPVAMPVSFGHSATGMLGFRPRDEFGSGAASAQPSGAGDAGVGSFGISQVSAAAYNSMSGMNHLRFECGVDLKALLKTSRKRLVKGLWASPDSPDALSLGYMTYTASH